MTVTASKTARCEIGSVAVVVAERIPSPVTTIDAMTEA
jgi:hypothetical protein